jgi:putative phosphoesterase
MPSSKSYTYPPQRLTEADATILLDENGALRLAIIADTHSAPHPDAAKHIRALAPDAILHAGDIGDLQVLEEFAKIAPVIAVRGNIDERVSTVPDAITVDVRAGSESAFKLLLMHIAVQGPKIRSDAAKLATSHGARMIVCGHSHVPFVGRDKGLTVFNPGSIGPRRMHLPIVFGILEIKSAKLSLRHINCETGAEWNP